MRMYSMDRRSLLSNFTDLTTLGKASLGMHRPCPLPTSPRKLTHGMNSDPLLPLNCLYLRPVVLQTTTDH